MLNNKLHEDRRRLIERMNAEMQAIANSPSKEVEKFRIGLLAKLCGELKLMNDKISTKSCLVGKVS